MSVTETIISFAVKKALDKAIGGVTPIITSYHKTHFVLLARALQESNRDQDIQKTLEQIRKNLAQAIDAGTRMVQGIPKKPEPPSSDLGFLVDKEKNKKFSNEIDAFSAGVRNVLEMLRDYTDTAEDLVKRTAKELAKIEKNLDMKGAKWAAMRQISNAKRLEDIQYIQVDDMEDLQRVISSAKSLTKVYANLD